MAHSLVSGAAGLLVIASHSTMASAQRALAFAQASVYKHAREADRRGNPLIDICQGLGGLAASGVRWCPPESGPH